MMDVSGCGCGQNSGIDGFANTLGKGICTGVNILGGVANAAANLITAPINAISGGFGGGSCGCEPPIQYKKVTSYEQVTAYKPQTTYKPVTVYKPETTYTPYTTYKPVTSCVAVARPKPHPPTCTCSICCHYN